MLRSTHILNELNTISQSVANIPLLPVFTVPENYFSEFPEILMEKIREDANYETQLLSPLLGGMDKKMPFSVPEGYFSGLENRLKETSGPAELVTQAPVVRMNSRTQVWKLSAAAMIAGVIGISAWLMFFQGPVQQPTAHVNVKAELPKVSEKEIEDFLLTAPEMSQPEILQLAGMDNINVEDLLKDVQDDELQDFMKEIPDMQNEKLN